MYQVTIDSRYADAITRYMNKTLDGIGTFTYDPTTSAVKFDAVAHEHFTELDSYADCHIDDNNIMWVAGCDYEVFRIGEVDVASGVVAVQGDRNADGSHRESTAVEPWAIGERGVDRADTALADLGYERVGHWIQSDTPDSGWTCAVRGRA